MSDTEATQLTPGRKSVGKILDGGGKGTKRGAAPIITLGSFDLPYPFPNAFALCESVQLLFTLLPQHRSYADSYQTTSNHSQTYS